MLHKRWQVLGTFLPGPKHFIETRCRPLPFHASILDPYAFGAQALHLLGELRRIGGECNAAIGAQDALPGQLAVLVMRKDARHHAGTAGQAGTARDLAVTGHLAARNGAYRGEYFFGGRLSRHAGLGYG